MNKLLTANELAGFLNVPMSWVYERTYRYSSDPLPVIRLGRLLRFDADAIQTWLEQRQAVTQ